MPALMIAFDKTATQIHSAAWQAHCHAWQVQWLPLDSPEAQQGRVVAYLCSESPALSQKTMPLVHQTATAINDLQALNAFLLQAFTVYRWRHEMPAPTTFAQLYRFHARYKYQLMAGNPALYRTLGQQLSNADKSFPTPIAQQYITHLLAGLSQPATRGTHCNTLLHISGYLKKQLDSNQRQHLHKSIHSYQQGKQSLSEAIALLKSYFVQHPNRYISEQLYLQLPQADELFKYDF